MKHSNPLIRSNHLLAGIATLAFSLFCAGQTQAASVLTNGDFNGGSFTGWTVHADGADSWSVDTPGTGTITSPGSDYATEHVVTANAVDSIYQVATVSNAAAGTVTATISINRASDTGQSGSGGQWNIAVYGLNAGYTLSTIVSGAVPVGTPTSGGTLLSSATFLNITPLNSWITAPTSGSLTSSPSVAYSAYEVLIYSVAVGGVSRNGHFDDVTLNVPTSVPESRSLGLLALGSLLMLGRRRRA